MVSKCKAVLKSAGVLILILGPSLYFGFNEQPAEMGVALAAGAIAAAFLNLDKLQKFKGAGIEVELKQAVAEAQATLENLKDFTIPLFLFSIKNMTEGQTFKGINLKDQHDIVKKIEKVANNNEVSREVIEALNTFYNFNLMKYFDKIYKEVHSYRREEVENEIWMLKDDEAGVYPSEKQILNVVKDLPHISPGLEAAIQDYAYYKKEKYPRTR